MMIPRAQVKSAQQARRKAYSPPRAQSTSLQKMRETDARPELKPLVIETPHEPQQPHRNFGEDTIGVHPLFTPSAMLYSENAIPHLQAHPAATPQHQQTQNDVHVEPEEHPYAAN